MNKFFFTIAAILTMVSSFADDELMTSFNTSTTKPFLEIILFAPSESQLHETYIPYIDRLILQMINEPSLNLYLTAYTHNSGNPEQSGAICEQRLAQLKSYIADRSVAPYRIICINKNFQNTPSSSIIAEANKRNNCIELQFQ
jgi:hypothetical protein